MRRQGWFRVAAFVYKDGTLIKEVLASCTAYTVARQVRDDSVKVFAEHEQMDLVKDDEWPEYMVVVTVLPGEPTKWEFKRV